MAKYLVRGASGFSNRRFERRFFPLLPPWAKVGRAGARKTPIQLLKEMGPPEAIMEKRKTAEAVFFGFCGAGNITPRP